MCYSIEEIRRILHVWVIFGKLGVDRQDIVEAMYGVIFQSLLTGTLHILDKFLFEDGIAYMKKKKLVN